MPAQPLSEDQLADARRLKALYVAKKKALGLTQYSVADMCGWDSQGSVSQYLNGRIPLNIDAAVKFARVLDVAVRDFSPRLAQEISALRDSSHDSPRPVSLSSNSKEGNESVESNVLPGPDIKGRVPLISWVQAGVWNEAIDIYEPGYAEQWLPVLKNGNPHVYALRVQGDSMTALHGKSYPEGTIIIVDPELRTPTSGQRVIAKLAGSNAVTFKVYVEEDGRRWLKPLNHQHQPIHDEFRVLGTVTAKYEPE